MPLNLLRTHVLHRPHPHARRRDRCRGAADCRPCRSFRGPHLRQPEIQKLRSGFRQHDVAGLQISMHDTDCMCSRQRASDLDGELEQLGQWKCSPLQPLCKGVPLQELHHQVIDLALAANVVQRANVGMVQR